MKTNLRYVVTTLAFFILIVPFSSAQTLSATNQKAKTEEGFETDAWVAHLDQDINNSQKSFEEFIEKVFKYKTDKRSKGIYVVEKQKFPELSQMRLDIRAIFSSESAGSTVSFIFSPGYDVYLNNTAYTDDFLKAENFVKNYIKFHYNIYYTKVIADLNSKIKDKEDEIKSTESKIDKIKSTVAENDTKITSGDPNALKLKEKNTKYHKEIDDKNAEISGDRRDIVQLQDEVVKANASLKLVQEYK